jgi:hypothetical protein
MVHVTWNGRGVGGSRHFADGTGLEGIAIGLADPKSPMEDLRRDFKGWEIVIDERSPGSGGGQFKAGRLFDGTRLNSSISVRDGDGCDMSALLNLGVRIVLIISPRKAPIMDIFGSPEITPR